MKFSERKWNLISKFNLGKIKGGDGDNPPPPDPRNPHCGKPITIK